MSDAVPKREGISHVLRPWKAPLYPGHCIILLDMYSGMNDSVCSSHKIYHHRNNQSLPPLRASITYMCSSGPEKHLKLGNLHTVINGFGRGPGKRLDMLPCQSLAPNAV